MYLQVRKNKLKNASCMSDVRLITVLGGSCYDCRLEISNSFHYGLCCRVERYGDCAVLSIFQDILCYNLVP